MNLVRRVQQAIDLSGELTAKPSKPSLPTKIGGGNVPVVFARRRQRARHMLRQFLLIVLAPTVLAAVYYFGISSGRYVSETQLVVEADGGSAGSGDLLGLVLSGGMDSRTETMMLYDYLLSRELVAQLEKRVDLRGVYGRGEIDFLSRLSAEASQEDLLEYFLEHVEITAAPQSPVVKVRLQAYTPEDAQTILTAIVQLCEEVLNLSLEKKRTDSVAFAKKELAEAEAKLAAIQQRINAFRHEHGELDPIRSAEVVGQIAASLSGQLSAERAKLEAMLLSHKPESSQVVTQKAVIRALEAEIAAGRGKLAGGRNAVYADLVTEYQNLQIEQKFAETSYGAALSYLETARADAQRQHSYVVDFVPPFRPDEPTEPNRPRAVLTVFLGLLLAWGIGNLMIAAVREQAKL